MGLRHRTVRLAERLRRELIEQLGGKCVLCGEDRLEKLEFDHPHGRNWQPSKLSYQMRIRKYMQEAEQKLLRLLCEDCNRATRVRDGRRGFVATSEAMAEAEKPEYPF